MINIEKWENLHFITAIHAIYRKQKPRCKKKVQMNGDVTKFTNIFWVKRTFTLQGLNFIFYVKSYFWPLIKIFWGYYEFINIKFSWPKKMGLVIKVLYSSRSYKNVINKSTMCLEHENKFRQWTLMAKSVFIESLIITFLIE